MKLNVVSIQNELVRIQAEGEITSLDFTVDGKNPFDVVLGSRWATHKVVVDLRSVPFLDSSAIGWFMNCRREFERNGGLIVLHSVQPRVRQVLDLLCVGKAVPLVEDETDALTAVAAAAAGMTLQSTDKPVAKTTKAKSAAGKTRRGSKAA